MKRKILFKASKITKKFPGVLALNNVEFEVMSGEVLGLVGENGAGKSTLIKILSGALKSDCGKMTFNDETYNPEHPQEAQTKGIATIYQELSLIPGLTVAQNLFLGAEPRKSGFPLLLDYDLLHKNSKEILNNLEISNINVKSKTADLSISSRQMIEIARAASRDASIILMDEPTSSLASDDVKKLFEMIRRLKNRNVSVVFISHRLPEVIEIADRIIVMRDGNRSGTLFGKEITEENIIRLMVGRKVNLFKKEKSEVGEPVIKLENISY